MKALVTGATGFIGGNLVRELLKQGYRVRALVRRESNRRNVEGLALEVAIGDLRDRASLEAALEGCDVLFHVAAAYTFWSPEPASIYETNVKGTENILLAARNKGIKKIIYTSTESTIGTVNGCPGNEAVPTSLDRLPGHYKRSKYLAEKLAMQMCQEGLPLVVVNPTMPIGPWDVKPTPTGRVIVDFLSGRMPACVNTGLNVVAVEDVARGHILALEKGQTGERYILGNRNLTLREIFAILERTTGVRAPRFDIPLWLASGAAYIDGFVSGKVLRRPPRVPLEAVRAACKFRHFDCSKAVRELGFSPTPVEEAFDRAVRWFRQNGYVS
ncbi:MAG: NAD-dependent epimerase/dehydratase family protein [Chloroflexi bacterium]|nr:NAD-dependent epimerase/dehydratase family protein [Chloroflexota bacterium]